MKVFQNTVEISTKQNDKWVMALLIEIENGGDNKKTLQRSVEMKCFPFSIRTPSRAGRVNGWGLLMAKKMPRSLNCENCCSLRWKRRIKNERIKKEQFLRDEHLKY